MTFNESFTMTIDGVGVANAGSIDVVDPATGSLLHQAPDCSLIQADQAVAWAQRAQNSWHGLPATTRRQQLIALCQAAETSFQSLLTVLCSEGGKLEKHAHHELRTALQRAQQSLGGALPRMASVRFDGCRIQTTSQPLGVLVLRAHWRDPVGSIFPRPCRRCWPAMR